MDFASDNTAGLSSEVLLAITKEADRFGPAYGHDPATSDLDRLFSDLFQTEARAFPVSSGTAANCIALACLAPPHSRIVCADSAHLLTDEATAPETFTTARLTEVATAEGLITADTLAAAFQRPVRPPHSVEIAALSLSQSAETGRCYNAKQVRALSDIAHRRGMKVHMDGARFANAVARLELSPAELAPQAGVDALSFGASKNGALAAEAVVFFDLAAAERFEAVAKRHGHLLCKMRFLSAQLHAYLAEGRWLSHARHANAMAALLAGGLSEIDGVTLAFAAETNILFVRMPDTVHAALQRAGAHYFAAPAEDHSFEARLVTSFQTRRESVEQFLEIASRARPQRPMARQLKGHSQ